LATSGELVLRPATPQDRAAWTAYLERAPDASAFHTPAFCDAVATAFGHRAHHLLALRGQHTVGLLPLFEIESLLGGRLLCSLPYATYGGILAEDHATRLALAEAAIRLVHERNACLLELRSSVALLAGLENVERYDGYVRDLPGDPAALETFLPQHARAAARQARQREKVVIEHDAGQLETLWQLYCRSMRRLGSLNYPYRFLQELAAGFGDRAWVTIARHRGQPVAGVFSLVFGDTVAPYVQGLDERRRVYGAMNLVYYAIMERAVAAGLRRFDFGRTRKDNPGPAAFKRNQGFRPRTLGYQRYVPPGATVPDLSPSNARFRPLRRIWQRLPLSLTRRLGAYLVRSFTG
jgi:FemAB-related protein (PEP-CTERM system-associated)